MSGLNRITKIFSRLENLLVVQHRLRSYSQGYGTFLQFYDNKTKVNLQIILEWLWKTYNLDQNLETHWNIFLAKIYMSFLFRRCGHWTPGVIQSNKLGELLDKFFSKQKEICWTCTLGVGVGVCKSSFFPWPSSLADAYSQTSIVLKWVCHQQTPCAQIPMALPFLPIPKRVSSIVYLVKMSWFYRQLNCWRVEQVHRKVEKLANPSIS